MIRSAVAGASSMSWGRVSVGESCEDRSTGGARRPDREAGPRSSPGSALEAVVKRGRDRATETTKPAKDRGPRGRTRLDATFPVAPAVVDVPDDYVAMLADIKRRVHTVRLRSVVAVNSAMIELYWDIGRTILDRQEEAGWGAAVIDRLSADLRQAYPAMRGFSSRNPKYMRYTLRDLAKPIGVADWATRLVESLPKEVEGSLLTIAQIEAELGEGGDP